MTIVQRLSLRWRRFSPLEERLFAAVRGVLQAPAVAVFDAQVRAVAHVQRLPGWTEIDYYPRRRDTAGWAGVPTFPRTGEFPLACVRFAVEGRRYRAVLSCVAGHIFDFGITPSPQRIAFAEWDSPGSVDLLTDPSLADGEAPGIELPDAWRDVVGTVGALAAAAGWALHDATTVGQITLDEGEFLVLAERDGEEFVLHRREPPSTVMFGLTSHDGTPEPIRGGVESFLQRPRGKT